MQAQNNNKNNSNNNNDVNSDDKNIFIKEGAYFVILGALISKLTNINE